MHDERITHGIVHVADKGAAKAFYVSRWLILKAAWVEGRNLLYRDVVTLEHGQ